MKIKKLKDFPEFENIDLFNYNNIDNTKKLISISNVLSMVTPDFDSNSVVEKTFNKHYNNKSSEYYHKTKDEILKMWEDKANLSRYYGKELDRYIELVFENDDVEIDMFNLDHEDDDRMNRIISSFNDFDTVLSKDENMYFVDREKYMYSELFDGYYIRGRFDALFYNPVTKTFTIVDWKSNENIKVEVNNFSEHLLGTAKEFWNIDIDKYSLQVYFYKYALETRLTELFGEDNEYKVQCSIVNLPGKEYNCKMYRAFWPTMEYNIDKFKNIYNYAYKKNLILERKNNN